MSDNREKLVDRGWENMEGLLDQEMPQQKKRRPLIWWWSVAAVLLLAIGAMYYVSHDATDTSGENELFVQESLESLHSSSGRLSGSDHNNGTIHPSDAIEDGLEPTISASTIAPSELKSTSSTSDLKYTQVNKSNDTKSLANTVKEDGNKMSNSPQSVAYTGSIAKFQNDIKSLEKVENPFSSDGQNTWSGTHIIIDSRSINDASSELLVMLSRLNSLNIAELLLLPYELSPPDEIPLPALEEVKNDNEGMFYAGVLGSRILNTSANQLGLQLGYSLKLSEKWGLSLNSNYLYGAFDETVSLGGGSVFADEIDMDSPDTQGGPIEPEGFVGTSATAGLQTTLHSAHLSIALYYNVNPELSLSLGPVVGYNRANTNSVPSNDVRVSVPDVNYTEDHLSIGGAVGIELLIMNRLSFGITYQQFFDDIIPRLPESGSSFETSAFPNSKSRLNVGLRYGF